MATVRERDILDLIEQNPLISQQEIADKCGITRSSVAVHISNLMKKGLITGKGYILPTGPYVAVVGGANMDIGGQAQNTLLMRDSNPGAVLFSPGGVGRNIAHNMALLGCDTRFISVFGEDQNGATLVESCRKAGVDISACPVLPHQNTAVYLYITSPAGEMELAVNDMAIYCHMTPAFIAAKMDVVNRAALCVADTNPPEETLRYLADNCRPPLVVDPVSTVKAQKIKPFLHKIHTLKCNRAEASVLAGFEVSSEASLEKAANALLCAGVQQVVVTMGDTGALCASGKGRWRLPGYSGAVVNVTGGGDAFTAALAYGLMRGLDLPDAAREGLAAGTLSVAHADTINPEMSCVRIEEILKGGKLQ